MEAVVSKIDDLNTSIENVEADRELILSELGKWKKFVQSCQQRIQELVDEMNWLVKGDYER